MKDHGSCRTSWYVGPERNRLLESSEKCFRYAFLLLVWFYFGIVREFCTVVMATVRSGTS